MSSRRSHQKILSTGAVLLLALSFQNCSEAFQPVSFELSPTHPDPTPPSSGTAATPGVIAEGEHQLLMLDRLGLESMFSQLFLNDNSSEGDRQTVASTLQRHIEGNQHLMGRPCNNYVTGDASGCGYAETNTLFRFGAASSAGREGSRIQVCRNLLSRDDLLSSFIRRIDDNAAAPTYTSMTLLIRLFFPHLEETDSSNVMKALLALDDQMKREEETETDRWRLLILTLCESPDWQLL